jgi:phage-related protein|tara:strand:+ start:219 stop:572 length:354 start_codon:yes stop_codon:yes gene_type:complete
MAAFPTTPQPDFGLTKRSAPKKRIVRFADGYEHRIIFGLPQHQNGKLFDLTWKNITEAESDTLETFLDARALDGASFTYTAPNEAAQSNYVCEKWTKTIDFPNRATIKASFREVFEP